MMEGGYSTIEPLPRGYEPACQLITIILRRAANFITPSCDLAARAKLISLHTAIKPNLNAPTAKLANRACFVPHAIYVILETLGGRNASIFLCTWKAIRSIASRLASRVSRELWGWCKASSNRSIMGIVIPDHRRHSIQRPTFRLEHRLPRRKPLDGCW
jgi:hypothetical protein